MGSVAMAGAMAATLTASMVVWMVHLVQTPEGRWAPGIGDPTFVGWLTVVAYAVAGSGCYRAYRKARGSTRTSGSPRLQLAWGVLTALLVGLGINKQLDLQSWFTEIGRDAARTQGWYGERRVVQVWFIRGLILSGVAALVTGWMFLRRHLRELGVSLLGAAFLVTFVLIRASSFHDVDVLLSSRLGGMRLNWLFELGGIVTVGWGARRYMRQRVRSRAPAAGRPAVHVDVSVRNVGRSD